MIGGTPKHTLRNKVWILICQKKSYNQRTTRSTKKSTIRQRWRIKGSLKLSISGTAHTQNFNNLKEETMDL